jgi:hypothetical protein
MVSEFLYVWKGGRESEEGARVSSPCPHVNSKHHRASLELLALALCFTLQHVPAMGKFVEKPVWTVQVFSWWVFWLSCLKGFVHTSSALSPRSISTNTDGFCEWKQGGVNELAAKQSSWWWGRLWTPGVARSGQLPPSDPGDASRECGEVGGAGTPLKLGRGVYGASSEGKGEREIWPPYPSYSLAVECPGDLEKPITTPDQLYWAALGFCLHTPA